jgi:hypothetical protein
VRQLSRVMRRITTDNLETMIAGVVRSWRLL